MKFASIFCLILLSFFVSAQTMAHMQDRFTRPDLWTGLITDKEVKNGYKCLGQDYCNTHIGRKCSYWGWCQDKSYSGKMF